MNRRLPNLNQLRAFEAAARHLSFKSAAEELHVTHAAISHQIKALEEDLGRPLFHRLTRKVELAPDAEAFAQSLGVSFDRIAEAAALVRDARAEGVIRISAVPAFGYRFVLPRLGQFREAFPKIEVEIELHAGLADLGGEGFDAALRYGAGTWPGLDGMLIFGDLLAPMASPALLAGRPLPLGDDEIAALPYAVSPGASRDWRRWFRARGQENLARPQPIALENRAVVLDYLLSGAGAALADLRFAAIELAAGHLVQLHPETIRGTNGTFLVWPKASVADPRIAAFGTWLKQEVDALNAP